MSEEKACNVAFSKYEPVGSGVGDPTYSSVWRASWLECLKYVESLKEKMAPVQGWPGGIPWSLHLEAYAVYCARWGKQQALIEGGCRGGFSTGELDDFIPYWRERISELTKIKKELADAKTVIAALLDLYVEVKRCNDECEKDNLDPVFDHEVKVITMVLASKNITAPTTPQFDGTRYGQPSIPPIKE